ncbi:MAG: dienelactone hydrolase family protein [Paenibacillaceae bacterium]
MMNVLTEWVRYGEKGEYSAFIARTNKLQGKVSAIVLIQEIWGVDAHVQDIAKRIAEEGYAVIAPELFSYQGIKPDYLQDDAIKRAKKYMDTTPNPT